MHRPCPTDRQPECAVPTPPVIELLFGEPDPHAPVLVLVTSLCAPLHATDGTWSHRDATLARRAQKLRRNALHDGQLESFDHALALLVDTLSDPIFDPDGPVAIAVRGGDRPVVWEVALPEPPKRMTLHTYGTPPHWLAHAAELSGVSAHEVPDRPVSTATAVRVPAARQFEPRVRDGNRGIELIERSGRAPAQWRSPGYSPGSWSTR